MPPPRAFTDAEAAVDELIRLYADATTYLRRHFAEAVAGGRPDCRFRAFYPEIRIVTTSFARTDSRLSFGHVAEPGHYAATITRPDLFANYLCQQIGLLIKSHDVPVTVGYSRTPIPIHFAVMDDADLTVPQDGVLPFLMRDVFDVPDLQTTNDDIVNGVGFTYEDGARPLAPFTAQRIDYSLARLTHYTATAPEDFQNHILFTNYQFYVTSSSPSAATPCAIRLRLRRLVGPTGQRVTADDPDAPMVDPPKMPQMPTYHLTRKDGSGITLVNIGVGPSNAKTATDHIAVLRPHVWLMVGHCAGLRNSQALGDFVLAHAYLREDHVLDDDLPVWVPIPALAEVQIALEDAVEDRSPSWKATSSSASCAPAPWRPSTTATGNCATSPARCSASVAVARRGPGHGKRHHRRQRLPLPRPLRHAPLRLRQAPARRVEAARHGLGLLPDAGQPPSDDRNPRHGDTCARCRWSVSTAENCARFEETAFL